MAEQGTGESDGTGGIDPKFSGAGETGSGYTELSLTPTSSARNSTTWKTKSPIQPFGPTRPSRRKLYSGASGSKPTLALDGELSGKVEDLQAYFDLGAEGEDVSADIQEEMSRLEARVGSPRPGRSSAARTPRPMPS